MPDGTHKHVGLDPVTGKPASFIGSRIPALKKPIGERRRQRLWASAHCTSIFLPKGHFAVHQLLCGLDDPERNQPESTSWARQARPAPKIGITPPSPGAGSRRASGKPGSSGAMTPLPRGTHTQAPSLPQLQAVPPTSSARPQPWSAPQCLRG